MTNKLLKLQSSPDFANPIPNTDMPSKRFGKKAYISIAAIATIAVILAAIFLVPPSNAEIINLGVHYTLGEKLVYDITTSSSSEFDNSSTNFSTQTTLTVEVLAMDSGTYTLNYTTTTSTLGYSMSTSKVMQVKETDMINLLTLMPVALQQYAVDVNNTTSPLATAIFNQKEAKVGDSWQIPLNTLDSGSSTHAELSVKFVAIQSKSTSAGQFRVFRIDFSQTNTEPNQSSSPYLEVSGQSYLEMGTCKQIQSNLQLNMTNLLGINYKSTVTFSSILVKDIIP